MPHSPVHEDAFREIQLNGKQLVFLFMAATVVAVVIFLCGVLVGRGVSPVSTQVAVAPASDSIAADSSQISGDLASAAPPIAGAPTEPPPTPNELTYYDRLEKDTPPPETLKPTSPARPRTPAPEPVRPVVKERRSTTSTRAAPRAAEVDKGPAVVRELQGGTGGATREPSGSGYAVQVAALRGQNEADAIARRLTGKGYPAYVLTPSAGTPAAVFRVRVGKFSNRHEADQVAARLAKEEQFKPWIVR